MVIFPALPLFAADWISPELILIASVLLTSEIFPPLPVVVVLVAIAKN